MAKLVNSPRSMLTHPQNREHNLGIQLLHQLHSSGVLSPEMVQMGFYRTVEALDDLCLDVPAVATILGKFVLCAVADGSLSREFLEAGGSPNRGPEQVSCTP